VGVVYEGENESKAGLMKGRRSGWPALLSQEGRGGSEAASLQGFAWEPPLARSLRAHAALLTQEGGPPAPTTFYQTRAVHSFTASMTAPSRISSTRLHEP
jgi:hypothetical protein